MNIPTRPSDADYLLQLPRSNSEQRSKAVRIAREFNAKAGNGKPYFNCSRSGHNSGSFNVTISSVNYDQDPTKYIALQFVRSKSPERFMSNGDSGCFILSEANEVKALGFSGCEERGWGYGIPIQDVYENIEERLGCKVVDPEYYPNPMA